MEKFAIYGQNPQISTGTKKRWYQYPLDRGKVVLVPINVVPVPIHHNRVGTGPNQSGTDTDASCSPDFCTIALLSPKFVYR